MPVPLTLATILRRNQMLFGKKEVVTRDFGGIHRYTYADYGVRVGKLANALSRLGVKRGDRVGTFGWNSHRHLEAYLAVPCMGSVLHTINIRLFTDQLAYIVNHAEDSVLLVDLDLVPSVEAVADKIPSVRAFVIMSDKKALPATKLSPAYSYEELLDAEPSGYAWPEDIDENSTAALCYTTATTGNPKGVPYTHRGICLHALAICTTDQVGIGERDAVMPVVPMFHVNAWGTPFAAALTGASLLMPTRFLQAEPLARFIAAERPTTIYGVPTVMNDLLRYADEHRPDLSSLTRGLCGGSAVPVGLMRGFEERHGVKIIQGWGMTETSPVCAVALPPVEVQEGSDEYWRLRAGQGRVLPWVEMRIASDDRVEPWDGESVGEVQVRGPWIASRYFGATDEDNDEKFDGPWLRTGDIGMMDPKGYVQLTDRAKDLIKSGGEWISSVELENAIMEHDDVLEAAVIARPDERWDERPMACVVCVEGATLTPEDVRAHLEPLVAKWWLPEAIVFIDEVPKTSVGKFDKKVLRQQLHAGDLFH